MAVSRAGNVNTENNAQPNGNATIETANDRAFNIALLALVTTADLVVSTMTVGGQSPTVTYEDFRVIDGTGKSVIYSYWWDEATLAGRSGDAISYIDNRTFSDKAWIHATYQDVNQTTFPKLQAFETSSFNAQPAGVDTTSTDTDFIIGYGVTNSGNRNFSAWDTLTGQLDVEPTSTNARFGMADGVGDNDSTQVLLSGPAKFTIMGIVLGSVQGLTYVPNQTQRSYSHSGRFM